MFLFVGGDQDVVLVFALLPGAVLEGGDPVSIFPIVEPLPLVLQPVRPLADPEPAALVVLPLPHVGLGHVGVQHLVLGEEYGVRDVRESEMFKIE